MLDKYKKNFLLQIKKIEINYRSWKNAQEIAKAYNQEHLVEKKFKGFLDIYGRKIGLYAAFVLIALVFCAGIWVVVKQVKKHDVTVSKPVHKENSTIQVKDTIARVVENSTRDTTSVKHLVPTEPAIKVSENSVSLNNEKKDVKVQVDKKPYFLSNIMLFFNKFRYDPGHSPNAQKEVAVHQQGTVQTAKIVDSSREKPVEIVNTIPVDSTKVKPAEVVKTLPVDSIKVKPAEVVKAAPIAKKVYAKAAYYILVANKAEHSLYLIHQNAAQQWALVKKYEIEVGGGQAGPKISAGDRRTPEGLYFIILKKDKFELTSIYGPTAYVLNYPNEEDRKRGKTGQGIWIHGTQSDSKPIPTKGCLSLANNDILDLAKYLEGGTGTPVVIVNDSALKDPVSIPEFDLIDQKRTEMVQSQQQLVASLNTFLTDWIKAWESRDIQKYEEFYSVSQFSSQGMNWKAWKEKKLQTFQAYNSINVEITKFLLSDWSNESVEIKFLQNYKSDQKYFENGKKLFLEKNNEKWKITREITIPKEELLL